MPKNNFSSKFKCANKDCNEYVSMYENRTKEHINICQDPAKRKFCSLKCKRDWVAKLQGYTTKQLKKIMKSQLIAS